MTPSRRWFHPRVRLQLRAFLIPVIVAIDSLALLWKRRRGHTALIVRLDAIGDFVIWLQNGAADITLELRRHHPRVVLLANPAWAAMARELKLWDDVVPIEIERFVHRPWYRLGVLCKIRRLGISVLVQPRAARAFLLEDEIARVSGAPFRIGSDAVLVNITPKLRMRGNRAYSRIVPVAASLDTHESFRGRAFAAAFCAKVGETVSPRRLGPVTRVIDNQAGAYFVIAAGASWSGRRWPIEKFAAVLTRIQRDTGLRCIAIGGAADRQIVESLQRLTHVPVSDQCGKLTLAESVRLIGGSRLVIANESGPMHIGIWCAVPVIGLIGGGHFGWFAPYPAEKIRRGNVDFINVDMPCYQCNWTCQFEVPEGGAVPCVRDIPADVVTRSALRLIHFYSTE